VNLRFLNMTIKTGPYLDSKEVFIDYPYEEVMFRREPVKGEIYRKFYGDVEFSDPIPGMAYITRHCFMVMR